MELRIQLNFLYAFGIFSPQVLLHYFNFIVASRISVFFPSDFFPVVHLQLLLTALAVY